MMATGHQRPTEPFVAWGDHEGDLVVRGCLFLFLIGGVGSWHPVRL